MPIKLTAAQYKIIGLAVAVAAVSLAISFKYFGRAFPEASLDLHLDRNGSTALAEAFLTGRGFKVAGYRHAAIFSYNDDAKVYLERTQGLARMDALTRGPIHLWRWSHRWFRPQQKEEFRVDVSTAGAVVGFSHEIPEAAPGANLEQPAARAIAEQYLGQVMKFDLGGLEFVEGEANKRPARTDYTFTWKQTGVNLGDGSHRIEVDVAGDQVSASRQYVKIPEQWSRDYEKLRSRNDSAQIVDEVFWVLLSVVMLAMLVMRLRDRDLRVRLALGFGLGGTVLYFLNQANTFSLEQFGYYTTVSYSSFVAEYLGGSLLGALGVGTLFFLLVLASEPVYRESFPRLLSVRSLFTRQGLRSRSFLIGNIVGLALTCFFFAYQTVFYLAANKLGAWAPAEPQFSNDLNTRLPWMGAVYIGFIAAVSEEMQFRAFAIPFLKKITHSWPLALVLAAFNWGFLHSAYPNQPFFIRGVEVGLGGIIMGVIMLRFGIVATLIWHYSVDALYSAFLLLRSPNHYLMISGAITAGIMLVPLVGALVAYWRTGTFTDEAPLSNASEGVHRGLHVEPAAEPEVPIAYQPLSSRRLVLLAIVVVVFAGLASVPVYHFGEGLKVRVDRAGALRAADAYLAAKHVSPASYHQAAWLDQNVDALAMRYLLERRTVKESDQIYRQATRPLLWEVRYFRPLEKEEHLVFVDATSSQVFAYKHPLDENAPGATVSTDAARALAERALVDNGYSLASFDLQDSETQKRKARQDYTFTWQAKAGDPRNVGDAFYRVEVAIAGNQVVAVTRFFKLPEDWIRARQGTHLLNDALIGIRVAFSILLAGGGIILFIKRVRSGQIPWRTSVKVGVFLAVIEILLSLNQLIVLGQRYDTSISLAAFHLFVTVSVLIGALLFGLMAWLLVGLATSVYPEAWNTLRASARRVWRRDALAAMVVAVAAGTGLHRLEDLVVDRFHVFAPVDVGLIPGLFDSRWPAVGYLLQSVAHGVLYAAAAGVVIYLVLWSWKHRVWFWGAVLLLLASLGPSEAHSVREFALGWTMEFVSLLVTLALVLAFFRRNVLAYLGAAFCVGVADPLVALLSEPAGFFRWNGVLLAALTVAVLLWLLPPGRARRAG